MTRPFDEAEVRRALHDAWSLESAVQWTPETPAAGQCNVTAAVVHDLFGGEILRTELPDVTHFYNRVDGRVVDVTDSQFDAPIAYDDTPSSRDAALDGIPEREYGALWTALLAKLGDTED